LNQPAYIDTFEGGEYMAEKKEVNAASQADIDVGSAADVEAIMKKYDRESNTRVWEGLPRQILRYTMALFTVFLIWMNLFATWDERIRRCLFLGVIILFVFALYPMRKNGVSRKNYIPWYDIVLAIAGAFPYFYYVLNLKTIVAKATRIGNLEIALGIIGILILAECCRRVVGIPILCVATAFILYAYLPAGKAIKYIIYNLFYTTTGVIGTPIGVCSTFIVLFIVFGAFLEATGIANFFIDCANAVAGSATGGPAKVAVISSALCGMVSGSSVGNTVTTGAVTIPLMKKTGYPAEFAGAVEAAASTGGQIMPPIMGAAAFLMAEIVGVPYAEIIKRAILPAFLYFAGIFLMVHFKAKKMGLRGLPKEELPKLNKILPKIYLLAPLVILVYMIITGFTMARSAIFATLACIVVSMFDKENRMTPSSFVDALENGTKNTLSVAVACGIAGIIAGVVTMTGLGQLFISTIVGIANIVEIPQLRLLIALFLTMLCCIILGMGVPTTANYIIMATTCAPILTIGMGMNVLAANMFVFYFGIVADITPPVALAAYAGAAIAKAPPMKTAFNATRLAIAAFIIPYIFAFNNSMLFIDTTPLEVIQVVITSCGGMFLIAAGLMGYMLREINWIIRVLCVAAGLLMIIPETISDVVGLGILVALLIVQTMANRKDASFKAA